MPGDRFNEFASIECFFHRDKAGLRLDPGQPATDIDERLKVETTVCCNVGIGKQGDVGYRKTVARDEWRLRKLLFHNFQGNVAFLPQHRQQKEYRVLVS